jgi:hypothetical protein
MKTYLKCDGATHRWVVTINGTALTFKNVKCALQFISNVKKTV